MERNLFSSFMRLNMFYLAGAFGKEITRAVIPWDKAQTDCVNTINNEAVCELVSSNSAPDSVQAFAFTFGVASVISELFKDKIQSKYIPVISAGVVIGSIIVAELIQALMRKSAIDMPDITMEILGMIPAWIILAKIYSRHS